MDPIQRGSSCPNQPHLYNLDLHTPHRTAQTVAAVTYIWELYYEEMRLGQWVGSTIHITVKETGKYTLHLRAVLADKTVVATSQETVYVKVRGLRGLGWAFGVGVS